PDDGRIELALERRSVGYYPHTLVRASVRATDPIELDGLSAAKYTLIAWTNDGGSGRMGVVRQFSPGNLEATSLKLNLEPTLTLRCIVREDSRSEDVTIGVWYFSMRAAGRENPDEGYSQVKIEGASAFSVSGLFPGEYQVYAG